MILEGKFDVISREIFMSLHKTFNNLETILKKEPVLIRADDHNYVRIIAGSETDDLYDKDEGHTIEGRYARVWYKK